MKHMKHVFFYPFLDKKSIGTYLNSLRMKIIKVQIRYPEKKQ